MYFRKFTDLIDLDTSTEDIHEAINKGTVFEKVHSNDISEFVVNHDEVLEKFENRFVKWEL